MKKPKKREKLMKKCPRCGSQCATAQNVCHDCGLIFSRLELATNAEAKRHILRRDKDFIIYTKDLPKDVKRWKLILLALLTGLVGGHYYYVGKYWKGFYMTFMFIWLFVATYFNSYLYNADGSTSTLGVCVLAPLGIYAVVWLVSIALVISNKFKVPIMVEEPKLDEMEKMREDFGKLGQEIQDEIDKNAQKMGKNQEKKEIEKGSKGDVNEEKIEKLQGSVVVNQSNLEDEEENKEARDEVSSVSRKTGKTTNSGSKLGSKTSVKSANKSKGKKKK